MKYAVLTLLFGSLLGLALLPARAGQTCYTICTSDGNGGQFCTTQCSP